ncbi:hypothetical protein L6164_026050 [Bauhinia variegata]|uniref:Uncharacterized protein n=1 Tax=Bauhinia variegata TaxID=167791 RepID=A0ACB9M2V1_BAUVA|nr:hypothetical protein L6164_026050 [Bauhinia variegata]
MSTKGFKFYNVISYDCELMCRRNCSCLAYYYSEGTDCEIWFKGAKFIHTKNDDPRGQTINFVGRFKKAENRWTISLIAIGGFVGALIFCYICYVIIKKWKEEVKRRITRAMLIKEIRGHTVDSSLYDIADQGSKVHNSGNEIQILSFRSIVTATKNFSIANKLGQGGFGSVYKGKLPDGQDIAIKRLSKRSGQGLYAMNGIVSIKTDVFSFGVLVLEILSGRKTNSRSQLYYSPNLIGLAWQLWNEGKVMELIDQSLLDCCPIDEALRCVQLGLLCVQDRASDRPSMLEVVSILSKETVSLLAPKKPLFCIDAEANESHELEEMQKAFSINGVTISVLDAR